MAASTLDLESDRESTVDEYGSAVVKSASKEQISTVLSKLQGRAANYKDKYRDLVKKYNNVVTENNKCRVSGCHTKKRYRTSDSVGSNSRQSLRKDGKASK